MAELQTNVARMEREPAANKRAVADHLRTTKSLEDVKADMSEQYELVKAGRMDFKLSAELSNIAGKYLKAYALEYAEKLYADNLQLRIARND